MWEKLTKIFISSAFPQPTPYQRLIHYTLRQSLFYFFSIVFLFNALLTGVTVVRHLFQPINYVTFFHPFISSLSTFDPQANIQVAHKTVTTNYQKPEFFWITQNKTPYLYLVIDEYADPQKIIEYNTPLLITHTNIVFLKNGVIQVKSIPALSTEITKQKIQLLMPAIIIAYILYPFVMGLFILILKPLIFALLTLGLLKISSIIIYLILKHKSRLTIHLTEQNLFKIGLFSSTVPIVLFFAVQIGGWQFKTWLCFPITILLFYGVAIYETMVDKTK